MRLDLFLFENGLASSRTEAKGYILAGAVNINGKTVKKPSYDVALEDAISVDASAKRFVSRGGEKLQAALDEFHIDVIGKKCLDVGASSGGFTDCLLKYGAAHVVAVDSGSSQLVSSLRTDTRVTSIEEYNARYLKVSDLPYLPELVVMDVSFISATLILPALYDCLSSPSDFILLIKPQFEVGRSGIGKGGIVRDEKARKAAIDRVVDSAVALGFVFKDCIQSPIKGGDGNIEFLAHFTK